MTDEIIIVRDGISSAEMKRLATATFGEMVKAVADVARGIMAVGGELHADAEAILLDDGSKQKDLWGFNIYPDEPPSNRIKYVSLINIRPGVGNRSMEIESEAIRKTIDSLLLLLVQE